MYAYDMQIARRNALLRDCPLPDMHLRSGKKVDAKRTDKCLVAIQKSIVVPLDERMSLRTCMCVCGGANSKKQLQASLFLGKERQPTHTKGSYCTQANKTFCGSNLGVSKV